VRERLSGSIETGALSVGRTGATFFDPTKGFCFGISESLRPGANRLERAIGIRDTKVMKMHSFLHPMLTLFGIAACLTALRAQAPVDKFLDRWALTIPDGRAGWLEVSQEDGYFDAHLLWGGGSVLPVDSVVFPNKNTLMITRSKTVERKDARGEATRTQRFVETIRATVDGDNMNLTITQPNHNGRGVQRHEFTGKRIPPLPPKPDLKKVKFGKPITLFNGTNLDQWRLLNEDDVNGWKVSDGVLVNDPVQKEGKPRIHYGNIRTKAEFEDFNLKLEVVVPENGNSGIYLRGIYEIQVAATYGEPPHSRRMGGIYSRVAPALSAEKPAGEWQTYDITLVDRHVTVYLNGKKIHDNVPLAGCTGGALWSDVTRPGPIYLQGDHTQASYKNIVLTPIVK